MNIKSFVNSMYINWAVGTLSFFIIMLTNYKYTLRVETKALLKWLFFLIYISLFRYYSFKFLPHGKISEMGILDFPWYLMLSVFWEDCVHEIPLFLLRILIGVNAWTKPIHFVLLAIVMLEFGIGHLYQGFMPALILSFYIPYTLKKGGQVGFGTIILAHITYDLTTLLTLKYLASIY